MDQSVATTKPEEDEENRWYVNINFPQHFECKFKEM